jgi:hypothetical protein
MQRACRRRYAVARSAETVERIGRSDGRNSIPYPLARRLTRNGALGVLCSNHLARAERCWYAEAVWTPNSRNSADNVLGWVDRNVLVNSFLSRTFLIQALYPAPARTNGTEVNSPNHHPCRRSHPSRKKAIASLPASERL